MRLTVRTLLAWRDRVLSEEDQHDLDEKVSSHDAAQEIEQRIERVLGNLDLPSPRVDAAGLSASANSMAEFLDNALSEECLGSFESNCIESDVQLCEAAECHQLLSEMLGQHELMIELTDEEMVLAKSTSDTDWETMCNSIHERTGIEIIGQMELNTLGGRPIH